MWGCRHKHARKTVIFPVCRLSSSSPEIVKNVRELKGKLTHLAFVESFACDVLNTRFEREICNPSIVRSGCRKLDLTR